MKELPSKLVRFLKEDRTGKVITVLLFLLIGIKVVLLLSLLIVPLPWEKINSGFSRTVRASDGTILKTVVSENGSYRFFTPLDKFSPFIRKGFVLYEDRYFRLHPGFNPVSLLRALSWNLQAGEIRAGGSTITMQIARMMEPKPRTYTGKLIELLRALQLETAYSKRRLLEIYLNMVPMGGNLEGVAAASLAYFGKEPADLGPGEASILIGIPRSPEANRPFLDAKRTEVVKQKIARCLAKGKIIAPESLEQALREPIPDTRKPYPFRAPHLSMRMLGRYPRERDIYLTLDSRIQERCDSYSRQYLSLLRKKGVNNLAVIVIENRTMSVVGYIGNPDYFNSRDQGQVDGVVARRSPGSTLKPLIYAKAFDAGKLTPATVLFDVPKSFYGYSPKNFALTWSGPVTTRRALVNSLNMPAVEILWKLSPPSISSFLESIGVSMRTTRDELGLSVALGSYPVSLENLANIYSAFAHNGEMKKVRYRLKEKTFLLRKIMSPASAWIVLDILLGLKRPDMPSCWEYTLSLPKVAWKTGTSFGFNDAWSVGVNPDYTVGVWIGNFSGRGSSVLVGMETATPLLFQIFNDISKGANEWFKRPDSVESWKVCTLSGLLPTDECGTTADEWFIPESSSTERCNMHKRIEVDLKTEYAVCDQCRKEKETKLIAITEYPEEMVTWARQNSGMESPIPKHDPSCESIETSGRIEILYPENAGTYLLNEESSGSIIPEVVTPGDTKKLYWFLDKVPITTSKPGEKIKVRQTIGEHILTCVDESGRSATVKFLVIRKQ